MIPYFQKLYLTNVRCFGPQQELDLTDGEGGPARWTLILGDNGTGKTTILKSLAACFYAYTSSNADVKSPNFNFWKLSDPEFFRRLPNDEVNMEIHSILRSGFIKNKEFPHTQKQKLVGLSSFAGSSDHSNKQASSKLVIHRIGSITQSVNLPPISSKLFACFGYSAARVIDTSSITQDADTPGIASLFDEEAKLMNAEEWLIQEDYRAIKNTDSDVLDKLERVKRLLLNLFEGEIHDIQFESKKRPPRVLFQTDYGWVRLHELSLGYKTLIAWVIDLANRMFTLYEESENPLAQPAIVLVDEIDLHMHPKFQRKLFHFLTSKFPNTQFIVTAHSPLIVQASQDANLVVLKKEEDHVVIENNPKNIKNWRVDQILTSDLFGLESARPPETEELLKKRKELLQKSTLSERDQKQLKELEHKIGFLPTETDPLHNEAMEIILKAAENIKRQEKYDQNH